MSTHNFVLIGEAGSGKTEIAANLALRLAEDMPVPVCLIDMDQTKCMFRAAVDKTFHIMGIEYRIDWL